MKKALNKILDLLDRYIIAEDNLMEEMQKLPRWGKECNCKVPYVVKRVEDEEDGTEVGYCAGCGGMKNQPKKPQKYNLHKKHHTFCKFLFINYPITQIYFCQCDFLKEYDDWRMGQRLTVDEMMNILAKVNRESHNLIPTLREKATAILVRINQVEGEG